MNVKLCFIVLAFALAGCGGSLMNETASQKKAVELTEITLPEAEKFVTAFPEAKRSISHFKSSGSIPCWTAQAILHNRFLVTIQIPVKIDKNTDGTAKSISIDGEVTRVVNEVVSVGKLGGGRLSIAYGQQVKPTEAQWEEILSRRELTGMLPDASSRPGVPGIDGTRQ